MVELAPVGLNADLTVAWQAVTEQHEVQWLHVRWQGRSAVSYFVRFESFSVYQLHPLMRSNALTEQDRWLCNRGPKSVSIIPCDAQGCISKGFKDI